MKTLFINPLFIIHYLQHSFSRMKIALKIFFNNAATFFIVYLYALKKLYSSLTRNPSLLIR
jgi:hypothetical protein